MSDDDLAGVANLDDEALDAVLAAGRRIAYARRDLQPTCELERDDLDPPGLG